MLARICLQVKGASKLSYSFKIGQAAASNQGLACNQSWCQADRHDRLAAQGARITASATAAASFPAPASCILIISAPPAIQSALATADAVSLSAAFDLPAQPGHPFSSPVGHTHTSHASAHPSRTATESRCKGVAHSQTIPEGMELADPGSSGQNDSQRSCSPVSEPRNPFLEGPTSSGMLRRAPFSCRRMAGSPRISSQLPALVFAKPIPAQSCHLMSALRHLVVAQEILGLITTGYLTWVKNDAPGLYTSSDGCFSTPL